MKKFDYYQYEKKKNTDKLRKTSGAKTFKICLSLIDAGLKILLSSIRSEKPKLSPCARHEEARTILWSREKGFSTNF